MQAVREGIMFQRKFIFACVLMIGGMALPTMTIVRGMARFSDVYGTAAKENRGLTPGEREEVVFAVECGVASVVGGLIAVLFGVGLALEAARPRNSDVASTIDSPQLTDPQDIMQA